MPSRILITTLLYLRRLRIGTWNLDGKWSKGHERLLDSADCDIWLLTEVADGLVLPDYMAIRTATSMSPGKTWAAVLARGTVEALPGSHPVTAAAEIAGVVIWSSILPWKGSGGGAPWVGPGHGPRTEAVINTLLTGVPNGPLIWGGDFNHGLLGSEMAGSNGGRRVLTAAVDRLGLQVPSAGLGHRMKGLYAIDHIAVPNSWLVTAATRIRADGLSDHDAYMIDVEHP